MKCNKIVGISDENFQKLTLNEQKQYLVEETMKPFLFQGSRADFMKANNTMPLKEALARINNEISKPK